MQTSERLILALDVPKARQALSLVHSLSAQVRWFKIGLQLFTAAGPAVVKEIVQLGCRVFLDLKFHDIPQTVASAGVEAARLGVHMMTLHTLGGREMMSRLRATIRERAEAEGWPPPRLLGVTVLTSVNQRGLASIGIREAVPQAVLRLAELARQAGLDGVVCSPRELQLLADLKKRNFLLVTPGIRSQPLPQDDQSRTMTAAQAIARGADFLVVGRPVIAAPDPVQAVTALLQEMGTQGSARHSG